MKKNLPLLVLVLLVLSGLGAVAIKIDNTNLLIENTSFNSYDEELDQFQTQITENLTVPIGQVALNETSIINLQLAQSFIPAKEVITKVELFIRKNSTVTYPLIVSIRKELKNEDLVYINIDPSQVYSDKFEWIVANFSDTHLIIGQTYYIVALTENTTENYYFWYGTNVSESYPFGCFWYSIDDGNTWGNDSSSSNQNNMANWIYQQNKPRFGEEITWDLCFKTYGRENMAPSAPIISGQTQGNTGTPYEYIFNATDPDSDNVKYIINWGDGTSYETDFNSSGVDIKISHSWSKKGTYYIKAKAKDIDDLVGPETTLKVKMPRVRISESTFFERFLHLFPFLQKLLGLIV